MDFNLLINNISNLLITFITIIFSAYIMFTELYLNRYANKLIKSKDLIISIIGCGLLIVLNSVIASLKYGVMKIIVALVAVVMIVIFTFDFIKKINNMKIEAVTKSKADKIIENIKNKFEKNDVEEEMKTLKDLYADSYNNNELYVCNHIVKSYSIIIQEYLKYANKCTLEGKQISKNKTFEKWIIFYFSLLKISFNSEDYNTKKENVNGIYSIIKSLLSCNENDLIKIFYIELNMFFREFCYNEALKIYIHQIYMMQLKLINYIVKENIENKREKLVLMRDNFERIFMLLLNFSSFSAEEYCEFFSLICKEYNDNEDVREIFSKPLINVVNIPNVTFDNKIFGAYSLLIDDKEYTYEFFIELLKEISKVRYERTLKKMNYIEEVAFYCFCKNKKYSEEIMDLHEEYMENSLRSGLDSKVIYFIDYYDVLKTNPALEEKININILKILMFSAKCKNRVCLMYYLDKVIKIILSFKAEEKDKQKKWFELLVFISSYNPLNSEMDFCQIFSENILHLIEELDKNKTLSEDFAKTIFSDIETMASFSEYLNKQIVDILKYLVNHEEDYKFFNRNEILKKFWYAFYKISIHSVEYKFYEQIKTVSNVFGWKIIKFLKNNKNDEAQSLITYSKRIFQVSLDLCQDINVNVFLGTLFAIVGGFTMTNICYKKYRESLCNFESNYKKRAVNIISKSKELRLSLSGDWDELIGGDSKKYIEEYVKEYIKI